VIRERENELRSRDVEEEEEERTNDIEEIFELIGVLPAQFFSERVLKEKISRRTKISLRQRRRREGRLTSFSICSQASLQYTYLVNFASIISGRALARSRSRVRCIWWKFCPMTAPPDDEPLQ